MTGSRPMLIGDDQFEEEVLNRKGLCLVDFWAPWCGPCHAMAPALEAFAAKNGDRIRVYKLDTEENPKTTERYEIKGIPTLLFFKDGETVLMHRGATSEATLQEKLDRLSEL